MELTAIKYRELCHVDLQWGLHSLKMAKPDMTSHDAEQKTQEGIEIGISASLWRGRVENLLLFAITIGGIILCFRLALPFLPALVWALALAVLFFPMHHVIESKVKRKNLATMISVLLIVVVVVAPSLFLAERLIGEAQKGAAVIKNAVDSGSWRQVIAARPRLAPIASWVEKEVDIKGSVGDFTLWLANSSGAFLRGSLTQAAGVLLTFYMLFYFLRDRHEGIKTLRQLLPLTDSETTRLFVRISDTIHATVYGTLAVAVVQGTLGGLMFWWLGLPAAILWGVVMAVLAMVPVLGALSSGFRLQHI